MMPNICIEKLDSDSDSENEEVKELEGTGVIKKSNTLGPAPISMSIIHPFNSFRGPPFMECIKLRKQDG